MTRRRLCFAFLTSLACILFNTTAAVSTEIEEVVSKTGLKAWLVREDRIPTLSLRFSVKGGSAYDPEGKQGLAYFVSGLLDEGADDLDSLSFQRTMEENAIELSFDATRDNFSGKLRTLSENRDLAFDLLHKALSAPRFEEEAVARIRAQILAGLNRQLEQPSAIAGLKWFETSLAAHGYGRPTEGQPDTIQNISRDDFLAFVKSRFTREHLIISAVGDITAEELGDLLDRTFGFFPEKADLPDLQPVAEFAAGETIIIRKPGLGQSEVSFGVEGLRREDSDWYAAYVMNYVVGGGGFTSRLTEEIREKRGLAYSVYSYLLPWDSFGILYGGVATRNDRVKESLDLIRQVYKDVAANGITEEELVAAKNYINGSFPLRLTSNERIASMLQGMQRYGLGTDYIARRPDFINAVTQADVARLAKRLLKADALRVVVVGNPSNME